MQLRARVDAILIGAGTLRADDPQLTIRGVKGARQPWRVVLTRSGKLPKNAKLFTDEHRERTLVFRGKSLRAVLRELGQRDVTSVLIEGGGAVLGDAFDRQLVDEVSFYFAPLLCGGPDVIGGRGVGANAASLLLQDARYTRIGGDLHVSGFLQKNKLP